MPEVLDEIEFNNSQINLAIARSLLPDSQSYCVSAVNFMGNGWDWLPYPKAEMSTSPFEISFLSASKKDADRVFRELKSNLAEWEHENSHGVPVVQA